MPDPTNPNDPGIEKYTQPQALPDTLGDTLASLQNAIDKMPDRLASSLDKALAAQHQLNRSLEDEKKIRQDLDKMLRGSSAEYAKKIKAVGVEKKEAQDLYNIAKADGIAAARKTAEYKKQFELMKGKHQEDPHHFDQNQDAAMRGMMGYQMGGAKGALLGASGWGSFLQRFIGSMGPGGETPTDVLNDAGLGKKLAGFRPGGIGVGAGLLKGLGGFGAGMGWVGAGLTVGHQLDTMIGDRARSLELAGQQVGGGMGAGLHMRSQAFKIGANPFDAITSQIANEIVQQTTAQGFKGRQADQIERAAASVYTKTGLSVEQILTLTTLGVRNMGLSVKETENEIKSFHDNLQDSNMSLQEYAQRVQQTAQGIAAQGGGVHSLQEAQAMTKAFPKPFTQESLGALTGNPLMQARQAAMLGVPIPSLYSATEPEQRMRTLQTIMQERARFAAVPQTAVFRKLHGRDPTPAELRHLEAGWMSQQDPYFKGIPADQIEAELKLLNQGGGPAAQATNIERNEAYRRSYDKVVRGARGVSGADIRGITDGELGQAQGHGGIGPHTFRGKSIPFTPRNKEELAYWEKYGVNPQTLHAHKVGVHGETHYLDSQQEKDWMRVRQHSLEGLRGSNVDPRDLRDLAKHISDPKYDWSKHLQEMRHRNSKTKGMAVDYQTADGQTLWIKLDPKTKSWYLEKDPKAQANNAGDGRRNDSRPYDAGKTSVDRSRTNYNG